LIDKLSNFISNHGGNIVKVEEWGKRRLAYEIKKKQYGYYVNIRYTAPAAVSGLLAREYRLNESVLRYLNVKVDPLVIKSEEAMARAKRTEAGAGDAEAWEEVPPLTVEEEELEPVA
jgi:small subunit ribosomal protein S6